MIGFTRYITCLSVCLSYLERDKRDEILSICLILEPSTVGHLIYLSYCGVKETNARATLRATASDDTRSFLARHGGGCYEHGDHE